MIMPDVTRKISRIYQQFERLTKIRSEFRPKKVTLRDAFVKTFAETLLLYERS